MLTESDPSGVRRRSIASKVVLVSLLGAAAGCNDFRIRTEDAVAFVADPTIGKSQAFDEAQLNMPAFQFGNHFFPEIFVRDQPLNREVITVDLRGPLNASGTSRLNQTFEADLFLESPYPVVNRLLADNIKTGSVSTFRAVADAPKSAVAVFPGISFEQPLDGYTSARITCSQFKEGCSTTNSIHHVRLYDHGSCFVSQDLQGIASQVIKGLWAGVQAEAGDMKWGPFSAGRTLARRHATRTATYLTSPGTRGGFALYFDFELDFEIDLFFGAGGSMRFKGAVLYDLDVNSTGRLAITRIRHNWRGIRSGVTPAAAEFFGIVDNPVAGFQKGLEDTVVKEFNDAVLEKFRPEIPNGLAANSAPLQCSTASDCVNTTPTNPADVLALGLDGAVAQGRITSTVGNNLKTTIRRSDSWTCSTFDDSPKTCRLKVAAKRAHSFPGVVEMVLVDQLESPNTPTFALYNALTAVNRTSEMCSPRNPMPNLSPGSGNVTVRRDFPVSRDPFSSRPEL